jgi:hypothetical protein
MKRMPQFPSNPVTVGIPTSGSPFPEGKFPWEYRKK